jgi:signal transduction histidine kinase
MLAGGQLHPIRARSKTATSGKRPLCREPVFARIRTLEESMMSHEGTERMLEVQRPRVGVQLKDVLITAELAKRPYREPNWKAQCTELNKLARVMANNPEQLVDALLKMALQLCGAETSGLSMLETISTHQQLFRWTNVAGTLKSSVGGSTPRNFSPCGVCTDKASAQLFSHPERYFTYFADANVPFVEALVIPVRVGSTIPGTIWILSHREGKGFDAEDVRIMTDLADFTGCALGLLHATQAERDARINLEREIELRRQTEAALRKIKDGLETEIESRTSQLQQLTGNLLSAQDDERRRIARELHDSTGQALAGLSMTIAEMHKDASGANLRRFEECRALIATAASEIRSLSYLLHPPLMDELGLPSAIAEYVEGFVKRSGIRIQVEVPKELRRLEGNREIALFRIIQESLGNIHRHSGSATASLRIFCLDQDIVLEIRDQGRGLAVDSSGKANTGVGIRSMQERLRQFGGSLQIESNETGTSVRAVLPRQSSLSMASKQTA